MNSNLTIIKSRFLNGYGLYGGAIYLSGGNFKIYPYVLYRLHSKYHPDFVLK